MDVFDATCHGGATCLTSSSGRRAGLCVRPPARQRFPARRHQQRGGVQAASAAAALQLAQEARPLPQPRGAQGGAFSSTCRCSTRCSATQHSTCASRHLVRDPLAALARADGQGTGAATTASCWAPTASGWRLTQTCAWCARCAVATCARRGCHAASRRPPCAAATAWCASRIWRGRRCRRSESCTPSRA